MGKGTVAERYEELGFSDALARPNDYPTACHELQLILRIAYADLPKSLQSVVFRDTLSAFRLLPEVQTRKGISSANILLQAAEVVLPKQKKALAVSEFKHSAVAHRRRSKAHHDGGSLNLPHDVLVQIFRFLDVRSLASVSLVCRTWNFAAADDGLWKMLYSNLLENPDITDNITEGGKFFHNNKQRASLEGGGVDPLSLNWKRAFRRQCKGGLFWKFLPNRLICKNCQSMIWLSGITCRTSHKCSKMGNQKLNLRPITPNEVVGYLLGDTWSDMSSDSDDSDSGGPSQISKLWAYPRLFPV